MIKEELERGEKRKDSFANNGKDDNQDAARQPQQRW